MIKQKQHGVALALLATTLACGFEAYDFDQDRFTKNEPTLEQLAGTYVPTDETLTLIEQTGRYQLQDTLIRLFSDGTFVMQNMPDWWRTHSEEYSGIGDSGNGTWSLIKHQDWWQIRLAFDSDTRLYFSNSVSGEYVTQKDISGDGPPYSLWFYVAIRTMGVS